MTQPLPPAHSRARRVAPLLRIPQREKADLILQRAELLGPEERALLHAVYDAGQSITDVARLRGTHPRCLSTRLTKLTTRVLSPEFAFVMRHAQGWPPVRRRIAHDCFVLGHSIRAAARDSAITFYAARRHHDAVLGMIETGAAC